MSNICITIKPDNVSWDEIHNVLFEAHASNLKKGIKMRKPSLPGDAIAKEIGNDGEMFVAMDREKIVGTASLLKKNVSTWYHKGPCGYLCFVAVLPSYSGKGVYKQLSEACDVYATQQGLKGIYFDTHYRNKRMIRASEKGGYKRVGVRNCGSHWNVIMFKRIGPNANLSSASCRIHYLYSLIRLKLYRAKKKLIG